MQYTQSTTIVEKELAMVLLSVIVEYFTNEIIEQYYSQLNPIIEDYLRSDQPGLKKLSVETVNKLATTSDAVKVLKKYNTLIPLVVNALDGDADEELTAKVFETFNEFVDYKKVLGPSLLAIIEKAMVIAANQDLGNNLRGETMYFLGSITGPYSKSLIKQHGLGFVSKLLENAMKIASEDPELYTGSTDNPISSALDMITEWAMAI